MDFVFVAIVVVAIVVVTVVIVVIVVVLVVVVAVVVNWKMRTMKNCKNGLLTPLFQTHGSDGCQ